MDEDAGPVVRPYTMTGGRARPSAGDFDIVALVVAEPTSVDDRNVRARRAELHPEHHAIIELAAQPVSVAELAATLDLALGVVRVLLGDLLEAGLVSINEPSGRSFFPDENVLKAVIDGLRSL